MHQLYLEEKAEKIIRTTVTTPKTGTMTLVRGKRASLKQADSTPDRAGFNFHVC